VDIVITRDNFRTLANVVIVDLICINLVQHALTTTMHATIIAFQDKARSYTEQTLGDDFIPFAIKTYDYFHFRFDSFMTFCVHACIACHQ
jgi:hypothetical protein